MVLESLSHNNALLDILCRIQFLLHPPPLCKVHLDMVWVNLYLAGNNDLWGKHKYGNWDQQCHLNNSGLQDRADIHLP